MKDITTKEDIIFLVDQFYGKAIEDEQIGVFFTTVVPLNFDEHLPVMYNFWESVLLGGTSYKGNPMLKHIELHRKQALQEEHFTQWLTLWEQTIDEHLTGSVAETAKARARSIKAIMQHKLNGL